MSEYVVTDTEFKDQSCLVEALSDFGYAQVEVGEGLPLYGYRGNRRAETADVVVRKQFVGSSANDVGFAKGADGCFHAIVSAFDRSGHLTAIKLAKLRQLYSARVVEKELRRVGKQVISRETVNGKIKIRVR